MNDGKKADAKDVGDKVEDMAKKAGTPNTDTKRRKAKTMAAQFYPTMAAETDFVSE